MRSTEGDKWLQIPQGTMQHVHSRGSACTLNYCNSNGNPRTSHFSSPLWQKRCHCGSVEDPLKMRMKKEPLYCSTQSSFFLFHKGKTSRSSLQVWVLMSSHKQGKILIIKSIVITISDTVHSGHIVVSPIWWGDNRQGNAILSVGSTRCSMSYLSPVTWTVGKGTKKSQIWGLFTHRHRKNEGNMFVGPAGVLEKNDKCE